MGEPVYGGYQRQPYPRHPMSAVQMYNNQRYSHPTNERFNPYQRPAPPLQQGMIGQSFSVSQNNPNIGQSTPGSQFNASQFNPCLRQSTPRIAAPMNRRMSSLHEQAMQRRMSSSTHSPEYSATSGIQGQANGNQWMASSSYATNGQFNQQNSIRRTSPTAGELANYGSSPSHPYVAPSPITHLPMSTISGQTCLPQRFAFPQNPLPSAMIQPSTSQYNSSPRQSLSARQSTPALQYNPSPGQSLSARQSTPALQYNPSPGQSLSARQSTPALQYNPSPRQSLSARQSTPALQYNPSPGQSLSARQSTPALQYNPSPGQSLTPALQYIPSRGQSLSARQSTPALQYKPVLWQNPPFVQRNPSQMVTSNPSQQQNFPGWNPNTGVKHFSEDFNGNPQPISTTSVNWQQVNSSQQGGYINVATTPAIAVNCGSIAAPMNRRMPSLYEQAVQRSMSSSLHSPEYSATSGIQGQGNGWMASSSYIADGQFNLQHSVKRTSPTAGELANYCSSPSHPYVAPSPITHLPMSRISGQTCLPQRFAFAQNPLPSAMTRSTTRTVSLRQAPARPIQFPPGITTRTIGGDWEVVCQGTKVQVRNVELWKLFAPYMLEMVVSRGGRRMFPVLEYDIKGLDSRKMYSVFLDFVVVNKNTWKFNKEQIWTAAGLVKPEDVCDQSQRICLHPDSPAPGELWNTRGVSFAKVKLSNHLHKEYDKLTVRSLHQYMPRLHIVEVDPRNPLFQMHLRTFLIPKTKIMTVTLYHNIEVSKLKIKHNPYAKCFREKELTPITDASAKPVENNSSPTAEGEEEEEEEEEEEDEEEEEEDMPLADDAALNGPHIIQQVPNPVSAEELQRAEESVQQQVTVFKMLMMERDGFSNTVAATGNVDSGQDDYDYDLDTLLSILPDEENSNIESQATDQKRTVHHYASTSSSREIEPSSAKRTKTANGNLLDKCVDRGFPPNVIAPINTTLPFDPSTVNAHAASSGGAGTTLPTFFKCNFYQNQAAQNSPRQDVRTNAPVVYVPVKSKKSEPATKSPQSHELQGAFESSASHGDVTTSSSPNSIDCTSSSQEYVVTANKSDNITGSADTNQQIPGDNVAISAYVSPTTSSNGLPSPYYHPLPDISSDILQETFGPNNDEMSENERLLALDDVINGDLFTGTSMDMMNNSQNQSPLSDEASLMDINAMFSPQDQSGEFNLSTSESPLVSMNSIFRHQKQSDPLMSSTMFNPQNRMVYF